MNNVKSDDVKKPEALESASMDVVAERREALRALMPEVFTEGKVDFEKVRVALGDTIETGMERYGLTWVGKGEAVKAVQVRTVATLVPELDKSLEFATARNIIIEGDNLEVLRLLQTSYHGKIKLIYIDPPYNTGKDFVYPDNFRDSLATYLEITGQKGESGRWSTNSESGGRYHSRWLSMMWPRLFLARSLLTEDGLIVVSIDDNELTGLVSLLDEIFGPENNMGVVVVQVNPRGRHLSGNLAKTHEYLVFFAKDAETVTLQKLEKTGKMLDEYSKIASDGRKFRELELRNRNPRFNKNTRPNLYFPIFVDPISHKVSTSQSETFSVEVLPLNSEGGTSCWTWSPKKVELDRELLSARQTEAGDWRVFRKDFLQDESGEVAGTKPKTVWLDKEFNHDYGRTALQDLFGGNVFDFPKSVELIKRIVELGSDEGDLVLDFFGGSGTTGHAVLEANQGSNTPRNFILVQVPEPLQDEFAKVSGCATIADLCAERVRRAILAEGRDELLPRVPVGFRYFRLAESNFRIWRGESLARDPKAIAEQIALFSDHMVKGTSDLAVLYEILLKEGGDKSGMELTVDIAEVKIEGQSVYLIAGGLLAVCLEVPLREETMRAVIARTPKPARVVVLDRGFRGNDQLKANLALELEAHQITFRTV